MGRALAHRGPDGCGDYHSERLLMTMRRLSIIDLEGGWQPLYNEDRSLALVANGEVYNFVELREDLEAKGHKFATGSDCETILHLYEDHGTDCVRYLRGMFAFALWDKTRRRLVLARDRMGEKPLYLYEQGERLVFASEMKALLASGLVPFELDPVGVDLYFHYQYVPEPRTPVKGVRKLDAGHILTIDTEEWRIRDMCYWSMEDAPAIAGDPSQQILQQLDVITNLVIRSDVPVGVALSGGLDSSAIAALAARKYPGTMHAFTVGYPGRPERDERHDAKEVADWLGMPFHEVVLTTEEVVKAFPAVNAWRDDPIADISGSGYYAVMRAARDRGVPVMLQGHGGDELFWGYGWMRRAAEESARKAVVWEKGWKSLPALMCATRPRQWTWRSVLGWGRRGCGLGEAGRQWHACRRSPPNRMVFYDIVEDFVLASRETRTLYTEEFLHLCDDDAPTDLFTFPHPWAHVDVKMTRLISDTYLRENGIAQGDRLGMASSVELRLPLVDYRLVETVIGLRKTRSDRGLPGKALLRDALREVVPDWVMGRPKRGFSPPVEEWHEGLFAAYGEQLNDGYLVGAGVISAEGGRQLAAGTVSPYKVVPLSLKALVLEMWCRAMSDAADGQRDTSPPGGAQELPRTDRREANDALAN